MDATIASLAQDGFAKTSIGRIVRRAKVSNGATGYHFPTKSALLVAAAEEMFERSRQMLLHAIGDGSADTRSFCVRIERIWSTLHSKPLMRAYLELSMAAQSDKRLARTLQNLARRSAAEFDQLVPSSAGHATDEEAASVFPLTRSLMLGMAIQYHCWGNEDELSRQLRDWSRILEPHLAI